MVTSNTRNSPFESIIAKFFVPTRGEDLRVTGMVDPRRLHRLLI